MNITHFKYHYIYLSIMGCWIPHGKGKHLPSLLSCLRSPLLLGGGASGTKIGFKLMRDSSSFFFLLFDF